MLAAEWKPCIVCRACVGRVVKGEVDQSDVSQPSTSPFASFEAAVSRMDNLTSFSHVQKPVGHCTWVVKLMALQACCNGLSGVEAQFVIAAVLLTTVLCCSLVFPILKS